VLRLATLVGCAALGLAVASVGAVEARPAHHRAGTSVPASAIFAAAPLGPRTARVPAPARGLPHTGGRVVPRSGACPAGLVALTFDDGPRTGTTAALVHTLRDLRVPATFFMVGSRVQANPRLARLVAGAGLAVANHTWDHARLTRLPDPAVRRELRRTARALRAAGVVPTGLARPPYGAVDPRVRADVRALGLRTVLWSVDSRDWTGGTPAQITARVLAGVRPHAPNVVLQHDGVDNSPNSVRAVPAIVRGLRARGFCLAPLGPGGLPVRPAATPPAAPARP
jgi:peptidoglycan/xylan/chitin deacetylase (PgdA/CDA1 family)